jgi:hypothetical protein
MNITFEIPTEIEEVLQSTGTDPGRAAKESLLVELYRQRRITHHQLGEALDLNRYEVDGVLKRHNVLLDLSLEDFDAEAASLRAMERK